MSDIVESKQNYDKTAASLQNLIQKILEAGEITQDDDNELVDLLTEYDKLYNTITSSIQEQKNKTIRQEIDELKNNKIGATVDDLLNILTENGRKTFIYKDDDNNILIDMKAIPSLVMLVNKFKMIASDGEDESSIVLTPAFIELLSNSDILLKAKNISLEGLITGNGYFKVLEDGSIEATNANIKGKIVAEAGEISSEMKVNELNVEGNLSADVLTIRKLNCQNISNLLVDDVEVIVSEYGSDLSVFENGAIFATLQGAIEAIPKSLNGNTVTITLNSITSENIVIKGFNGGTLIIKLNKNLEGNIKGTNCSASIYINGSGSSVSILKYNYNITGNLNMRQGRGTSYNIVTTIPPNTKVLVTDIQDGWGYTTYNGLYGYISLNTAYTTAIEEYDTTSDATEVKPSELLIDNNNKYSIYFENCNYVEVNKVNVYGKTETNNFAIGSIKASNVKLKDIKVTGSENGVYALDGGCIIEINTSGKVESVAHKADEGGIIKIEDGSIINGSIECSSSSQIIYSTSGAVKDNTTTEVGNNNNTTSATTTVVLTSNSADTYRSTIYNNYKSDNTSRQGNYGYGNCNGLWLFGNQFSKLIGKTITKLSVTVNRISGGIYGSVTSTLKMHTHASRPSNMPSYISGWSKNFTAAVGDTVTIIITDSEVLNAIKDGTCKGFGIQGEYDSAHYAVFNGNCTINVTTIN